MAKLVSKSGTNSVVWDYFGLELGKDEKLSMMLYARIVDNKCEQSTRTPQTCWHTSEQTTPQLLV